MARATLTRFLTVHGLDPRDYASAHAWSIADLARFWGAVGEYFDVRFGTPPSRVLDTDEMPGVSWFSGATVSYPEHLGAGRDDDAPALVAASELRAAPVTWSWGELCSAAGRIRGGLEALGVGVGDRVAAYLPNVPEAVAAFIATASLGAIWSSTAPEFGAQATVDRFSQIEPKVLLAADGYRYAGRDVDRSAIGAEAAERVGAPLVRFGHVDGSGWEAGFERETPLTFARVPFDHPLWILFSSGTTGLPKAIVHSHGGMLLEHLKLMHLQLDAQHHDRVMWFTTTGWMMWNFLVGVLLTDATIVLYDGSPAHPGPGALWDLAARTGTTVLGTSAAYLTACMREGVVPAAGRDLSALRAIGSTGSPLAPEAFDWVYEHLPTDTWLFSMSGGTDVCTAFLGGVPTLPVHRGELQAPALGAAVAAFDEQGHAVVGKVGELVLTKPMPCMPVGFWNDPASREEHGTARPLTIGPRYRDAYFSTYPGVWRHGDWVELTERGTAIIHGRSDATINRGGVRIGTSEIYRVVCAEPDVLDALVVDVPGRLGFEHGWMPLFVVLRDDHEITSELTARLRECLREQCSPRHVPHEIIAVARLPRTLSGKLLEVPVKRILAGADPDTVVDRSALADPEALEPFVALAHTLRF